MVWSGLVWTGGINLRIIRQLMKMNHAYSQYYPKREYVRDTKIYHSHLPTDIFQFSAPSASSSAKRISLKDLMPFWAPHIWWMSKSGVWRLSHFNLMVGESMIHNVPILIPRLAKAWLGPCQVQLLFHISAFFPQVLVQNEHLGPQTLSQQHLI